jgi:hypothetical protein
MQAGYSHFTIVYTILKDKEEKQKGCFTFYVKQPFCEKDRSLFIQKRKARIIILL